MEMVLANLSSTRRVTEGDREYLVAPLTLIVPGVLNGSQGSLYYPPEQIQRSVGAWNGIPITLHHPRKDGKLISVKDGGVTLGVLRNAEYRDGLKVEGWFELDSLQGQSPQLVGSIESGEQIELSTGLYTDNRPVKNGEHEGRAYTHVAENYRPDHLAILPDEKGACSVEDGCGVNVNYSASQPRGADGKFGSGGGGGGGGGGTHTVKLPKKKSKINIPQAGEALEEMGYKLGKGKTTQHEGQWTTAYEVTTPSGKTEQWSAGAVKDFVYKNQSSVENQEGDGERQGILQRLSTLLGELVENLQPHSNAYNPSQPRDAAGRFGSGGGSGGGGAGSAIEQMEAKAKTSSAGIGDDNAVTIDEDTYASSTAGGMVSLETKSGRALKSEHVKTAVGRMSKGSDVVAMTTGGKEIRGKVKGFGRSKLGAGGRGATVRTSTGDRTVVPQGSFQSITWNAQPHSKNTGRFKKPGQGTGRGDVHESAQMGAFDSTMLSEEDHALGADAYAQAEAGHNPISWVADEAKWQKAKASADKGNHKGATHWAVVTHIYKQMGGKTKESTKNAYNPSQSRDAAGKFGSGGGGGGGGGGGEEKSSGKSPKTPAELRAMTKGQLGTEYKSAIKQRDKQLEKAWKKPGNEKLRAGDLVQKEGDSSPLGKASARFDHANNEFKRRRMPTPRTLNIGQSTLPNPKEGDMPLTDNQRTAAVDKLLDCCWEQDDRETLEGLTDNQLTKLVKQTEDNEQLSLVANTAREALELPEDTTINAMPEALKKAIDAKKKKKGDGDEEEEEEEEVKKTENRIPPTEEQWREQAPQEVLEDLAFARNERARQKNEAIASVVGNLQGEERSKAEGVLLKLSTDDIKSITPIVPMQKRTANYGTVPPVGNEGDEELPMERRTWDFSPAAA